MVVQQNLVEFSPYILWLLNVQYTCSALFYLFCGEALLPGEGYKDWRIVDVA